MQCNETTVILMNIRLTLGLFTNYIVKKEEGHLLLMFRVGTVHILRKHWTGWVGSEIGHFF